MYSINTRYSIVGNAIPANGLSSRVSQSPTSLAKLDWVVRGSSEGSVVSGVSLDQEQSVRWR